MNPRPTKTKARADSSPDPFLRAGETVAPPPFPQKNCGGAYQEFRSKKVRANAKITPHYQSTPPRRGVLRVVCLYSLARTHFIKNC